MTALAYLAGVLHGDGWCTALTIGLRVADRDFSDAFAAALRGVFGVSVEPKTDERGYWLVRVSNKTGRFSQIRSYAPMTVDEKAAWLRGLFDSEGNAQLRPNGISENSYGRRVAIYSTDRTTLERARTLMVDLAIPTILRVTRNSASHKGTKAVYELTVCGSRDNYARFATSVGSSIVRKQSVLDAIPGSYRPDPSEHCRIAQRLGAATKHRHTMEIVLPRVVDGVRDLIARGVKPTQRACRAIPGYNTVQPWVAQTTLVEMALKP
jgi:hypothetical protein